MAARNVGLSVEGAGRLRSTLRAAGSDLEDLKAAHAAAAKIAERAASGLVPVKSGTLKASLRSSGTKTAAIMRSGGARAPYAGPIHWGWPSRGIPATPFLQDGARSSEPVWTRVYEHAVTTALSHVQGV